MNSIIPSSDALTDDGGGTADQEIVRLSDNMRDYVARRKLRVVVTTVSSDSHTWNLVFLQLLLEEMGHDVRNLGACVPDDVIVAECRQFLPDMLVVSTVNGHGSIDGVRLVGRIRKANDLKHLPVIIGGKLGIRGSENIMHSAGLIDAGFDAVFETGGGTEDLRRFVHVVERAQQGSLAPLVPAVAGP